MTTHIAAAPQALRPALARWLLLALASAACAAPAAAQSGKSATTAEIDRDATRGWEIGVGPRVVVVDTCIAKTMTTTTLLDDVYAFVFAQKSLMAGVGLQGSKITRINP
jgi:hypothetical protein